MFQLHKQTVKESNNELGENSLKKGYELTSEKIIDSEEVTIPNGKEIRNNVEPKESHDVDFIVTESTHNLDESKTNLYSQDSVPVAKSIVGTIAQKRMQEPKLTSKSVHEFNESLYNKDMKDDTSINFTNTSRIGNVEDGVGRSEVATITAVCKKARKALDASKHSTG